MGKTIIVSNRPVQISKVENNYKYTSSSGGLANRMNSIRKKGFFVDCQPGISLEETDKKSWGSVQKFWTKQLLFCQFRKKEIDEFIMVCQINLMATFHYFIEYSVFNINQGNHMLM